MKKADRKIVVNYIFILIMLVLFALWIKYLNVKITWQQAGMINFSLGFLLLAAYLIGGVLNILKLPLITGYILAGIMAGPHVSNFIDTEMVNQLKLIDDFALSFIAFTAGGSLHIKLIAQRYKAILLNIFFITTTVFCLTTGFVIISAKYFVLTKLLSFEQIVAIAILSGVIAVARSPSSAIAIINEVKASGQFTETVLGVTIVMDVLIIIFFTFAMTFVKIIMSQKGISIDIPFLALAVEMFCSIIFGVIIGKGISFYIDKAGYDLPIFLVFLGFVVAKISMFLTIFMKNHFDIFLHLEPLLICMSAGFVVQNFGKSGRLFIKSLESVEMPVYVLFFSLAGASLDFTALAICWPLAVCLAGVRAVGIFIGTWSAGTIIKDPASVNKKAWMGYLTQAGVAIGFAKLVQRQFPDIGLYLTTIVLAIISINQVIGPVMFKIVLNIVGDAGRQKK